MKLINPINSVGCRGALRESATAHASMWPYPYVYYWNRQDRKGQFCRVTARGKMNSCRVEFDDGFKMITSRNAIRKRQPT